MIGLKYPAKAIDTVTVARAEFERSTRRLADHDAAKPIEGDAEALYTWRRERRDLVDRVETDEEVLARAESRAEEARMLEARRAEEAENREMDKEARAWAKRVESFPELRVKEVPSFLKGLAAHVANTAEYNARRRKDLPSIVDGERRLREMPARTEPARFETREVWRDAHGRTPTFFRKDANGELVPTEAGFSVHKDRVQVRGEQHVGATMPTRLAEAVKLVGLDGKTLWG